MDWTDVMRLPPLMIDDNLLPLLQVVEHVRRQTGGVIELDGSLVVSLGPVAACLIAVAARAARRAGRILRVRHLPAAFQPILQGLDGDLVELPDGSVADPQESGGEASVSRQVFAARDANNAANLLANYIAKFIPREDRSEMLLDQYGTRIHHAIQPALAYVLTELVDNVFSHAATDEYRTPHAYMAIQSYPVGDLLRIAVVDDGCGLLGSLRGLLDSPPRNHFEAVIRAFEPFLSSKGTASMYAERRHMGLGLAVCCEICRRLGGRIYAASGNAWVQDPDLPSPSSRSAEPFYQGTVISLEIYRRGVTSGLLQDALSRFSGHHDLRLRFS